MGRLTHIREILPDVLAGIERDMKRTMKPRIRTRQILRDRSGMNATERAWAQELEKLKLSGQILWFAFEPMTLALGGGARYTPDFAVLWHDGELAFDETKGHWREAAKVRIKVAAARYPFLRFRVVQRGKRGEPAWKIEEVG